MFQNHILLSVMKKKSNCTWAQACQMTRFTHIYEITTSFWLRNRSLVSVAYSNPEVLNYNTYVSYDLLTFIGEIGGILGLTLGVSVLSLIESFLLNIPDYMDKIVKYKKNLT